MSSQRPSDLSLSRRRWFSAGVGAGAGIAALLGCRNTTEASQPAQAGADSKPGAGEAPGTNLRPADKRGLSLVDDRIDDYSSVHTVAESETMRAIARDTLEQTDMWIMMIGPVEAALLRLLVQLRGAKRVIEVGTFTGYSAMAMAEGLPEDGKLITCDISEEWTAIAKRHWATSPHGAKIDLRLAPASETLAQLEGPFDLAFVDADKGGYPDYWDAIVPKLAPGGLIVCDNVLAGGRVALEDPKGASGMAAFNAKVAADPRVQSLMLPMRDGVSISRKLG